MTTVTITPITIDYEPSFGGWSMKFIFHSGVLKYEFMICEANEISKHNWLGVANGECNLTLYCCDGNGGIYILDEDELLFSRTSDDIFGDIDSDLTVPRALVADKLIAAIEEATRLGFKFADHK